MVEKVGFSGCSRCQLELRFRAGLRLVVELELFLHAEVVHDVHLAFRRVFAHVEGEELLHALVLAGDRVALFVQSVIADGDGLQAHVWADEVLELIRRDFTEAFEAGDLGVFAADVDGALAFLVGARVLLQ